MKTILSVTCPCSMYNRLTRYFSIIFLNYIRTYLNTFNLAVDVLAFKSQTVLESRIGLCCCRGCR